MKQTGFILLLLTFFPVLSAQEGFKISKPEPSFSNNTLIIKYDLTGCGSGEFVDITLIILNSKGDTLKPGYISGDIGLRINCGFDKTIVWDLARDNVKIDEDIQILIEGKRSVRTAAVFIPEQKKITRGNILLSSFIILVLARKKLPANLHILPSAVWSMAAWELHPILILLNPRNYKKITWLPMEPKGMICT